MEKTLLKCFCVEILTTQSRVYSKKIKKSRTHILVRNIFLKIYKILKLFKTNPPQKSNLLIFLLKIKKMYQNRKIEEFTITLNPKKTLLTKTLIEKVVKLIQVLEALLKLNKFKSFLRLHKKISTIHKI